MATESNKGPWWLSLAIAGASLLLTGYVGYTNNDKEMVQRISRIEATTSSDIPERVSRVEALIDNTTPRLNQIQSQIEKVDDKIGAVDARISVVSDRVNKVDDKIDRIISLMLSGNRAQAAPPPIGMSR